MTQVLLINVDSTIPNLALMKLSTYHKSIGDSVGFNITDPDIVYASVIFQNNRHLVDGLRFYYPNAKINIGGTGYDLRSRLPIPEEAGGDLIAPDYDLYLDMDFDFGFTSRGCIRNCPFCVVPKKEGKFHRVQHPSEFHKEGHKKAVYLDNNILADKEWFFEVTDYIMKMDMSVDFNQGLDIRLMDEEVADRIKSLKRSKTWRFAYDSSDYRQKVRDGLEILQNAGIPTRHNTMFYVYLRDDSDFEDALRRCNELRDWGGTPYLMIDGNARRTKRMTALKDWCRPWVFWSCKFSEFDRYVKLIKRHQKFAMGRQKHA